MSDASPNPADKRDNPPGDAPPRHPLQPRGSHEHRHGHVPEHPSPPHEPAHEPHESEASRAPQTHEKTPALHLPSHHAERHGGEHKKPVNKRRTLWTVWVPLIVVLLIGGCVYIEKHKKPKTPPAPPAIPVSVTPVKTGSIDVILDALGTVTPVYTVSVTARVTGAITEIEYKEGQMVRKGDLLLVIDPRPYAAAVQQAAGQLARDQALLDNARIDLGRYQDAFKTHAIPEQQLATQLAAVKGDEGTVELDRGNLDAAQANLDYTQVRSPIDGRVGLRQGGSRQCRLRKRFDAARHDHPAAARPRSSSTWRRITWERSLLKLSPDKPLRVVTPSTAPSRRRSRRARSTPSTTR